MINVQIVNKSRFMLDTTLVFITYLFAFTLQLAGVYLMGLRIDDGLYLYALAKITKKVTVTVRIRNKKL
jgi:hypothetical protein